MVVTVKEVAEVLIGISATICWDRKSTLFSCCWHIKVVCKSNWHRK